MGSSLHSSIRALDSLPKTVVNYARPLSIVWGVDGSTTTDSIATRHASAVLTSYGTAKAYAFDEENTALEQKAPYNLICDKMK